MTDRELLELSAKAAGMEIGFGKWVWWQDAESFTRKTGPNSVEWWNPLNDDGDALRLAAKLRFTVAIDSYVGPRGFVRVYVSESILAVDEPLGVDALATTRLAIVRAAAAIGEKQ